MNEDTTLGTPSHGLGEQHEVSMIACKQHEDFMA